MILDILLETNSVGQSGYSQQHPENKHLKLFSQIEPDWQYVALKVIGVYHDKDSP